LRLVQVLVQSQIAPDEQPPLPRRRESDLDGFAAFTLDQTGRLVSWPATATSLFGHQAHAVIGQHVCDVLMTGPGHRMLVDRTLAQVAAGAVLSTTVAGGLLGDGRFALRWEPMAGSDGAVLIIVQRAWPEPVPGWLTAATARIGSSLDLSETALEVVEAAVTNYADAAVIYATERLLAADDRTSPGAGYGVAVRRLAARLAGQSEAVTSRLLPSGEVLFLKEGTPRVRAMATGQPVLSDQIDDDAAEQLAKDPEGQRVAADYASFLTMPLTARGVTVGCAVFARTPASPAFNPGDIALADELASRAAVCMDNARLYDRERRTAQALQRGLLPSQPTIPSGIEVAHLYVPVGDNVVGGDWHDIIALPGGRAALIVGDAMGHGPEAAAVMVQLRTAAHTLADLDLPPHEVLARLDALAAGLDTTPAGMTAAPFATCVYAVINPSAGTAEIARAGHLPPVLAEPGKEARLLDLPAGLPLGLAMGTFQVTQFTLPPGATLALYTDGLVESRNRPIDDGLCALQETLSDALARPGSTIDTACKSIAHTLREHGEDDMTLMLARIH
jgi:serine phosphatase RsbU (regulator of sigma subunit)